MPRWYIPDAYIPPLSTGGEVSHESVCVVNPSAADALITITAYFADRDPQRSSPIAIPARRDHHLRTSDPRQVGGLRIEPGVPYGMEICSEADLHFQYSRLDTSQAAYALMSTLPRPVEDGS